MVCKTIVPNNCSLYSHVSSVETEEPYQYYGTNSIDPTQQVVLKEMDLINGGDELEGVIQALEQEYSELNERYNQLLSTVSNTNNNDSLHLEEKTEEMKKILAEIEKKGRMLSFLQQYKNRVADQIRDATSPPKIRGADKRVKALRLIHELRSMSS